MIWQQHHLQSFKFNEDQINTQHQARMQRYQSKQFATLENVNDDHISSQNPIRTKIKSKQEINASQYSQQLPIYLKNRIQHVEAINSISELIVPQHKKFAIRQNQQDFILPKYNKIRKSSYKEPKTLFSYKKYHQNEKTQKNAIDKLRNIASDTLYKKYAPSFLFFMGKPINQIIYNQTDSLSLIDFRDSSCYSEEFQYLKRFYEYRTNSNRNQIKQKLVQLVNIYGKKEIVMNSMSAVLSGTMLITDTKSIFLRRHKRRQRLFLNWSKEQSEQQQSQKSKISGKNFKISENNKQWGSLSFLKNNLSSFYQKGNKFGLKTYQKYKYQGNKLLNENLEYADDHNIFDESSFQSNQSHGQQEDLQQLLENILPSNMFKISSSSEYLEVNHLVTDFNDIDEQITMKNYRELEKKKKNNQFLNANKNSGIMQISCSISEKLKQIEIFQRKSIRIGTSQTKDQINSGDQTPRFIANSKVSHKKTSSSQIIQRKQIKNQEIEIKQESKVDIDMGSNEQNSEDPPKILINRIGVLKQSGLSDFPSILMNGSQPLDESGENKTLQFSQEKNDMKFGLQLTKKLELLSQQHKKVNNETKRKSQKQDVRRQVQNILGITGNANQFNYFSQKKQRQDSFEELLERQTNNQKQYPQSAIQRFGNKTDHQILKNKKEEKPQNRTSKFNRVQKIQHIMKKKIKTNDQYNDINCYQMQDQKPMKQLQHKASKQPKNVQQLLKVKSQNCFKTQPSTKIDYHPEKHKFNIEKKEIEKINRQISPCDEKGMQRVHSTNLLGYNQNSNDNLRPKYHQKKIINSNFEEIIKNKELITKNIKGHQNKPEVLTGLKKQQLPQPNNSNKLYKEYLKKKEQKTLEMNRSPSRNILNQNAATTQSPMSQNVFVPKSYLEQKDQSNLFYKLEVQRNDKAQPTTKNTLFSKYSKKNQNQQLKQRSIQDKGYKQKQKIYYGNPKVEPEFGFNRAKYNQVDRINSPSTIDYKGAYGPSLTSYAYEEWKNKIIGQLKCAQDGVRPFVKTYHHHSGVNLNNNYRSPPKDFNNQLHSNWSPISNKQGLKYQKNEQLDFWKQNNYGRTAQKYQFSK